MGAIREQHRLIAANGERGHVVVIDDGSTDATGAILDTVTDDRLTIHSRYEPDAHVGKGKALNDAYREIRDRVVSHGIDPQNVVLCIIDADGRVEPDVLDHVVSDQAVSSGRGT